VRRRFFYADPNDPRIVVPNATRFGATFNMAHRQARLAVAAIAATPLLVLAAAIAIIVLAATHR